MDIQKNLIQLGQAFATKEDAITFCGEQLLDGGYVTADYLPAMLERNQELSVYMGNFIAIPHGTDAAKKEVLKTGITIVQVPRGVNFGDDAEPKIATVLFGIAGVGNEHLALIQKISIFCADVDNVVKLADAQTADEIADLLNSVDV
ncbi:MAG: PTS sugar transporter subunit IIA [Lactococcus sp.]|jgi:PTS system mannitol-specific IIA component|uniref:Mannitol-specific phosphotransferase enzyme IIA component n=1 Tax=Pseudolactococcus piscium MKFS47 TaxID=297352 RepID=A0A0D6DZ89_9LACT|nr:MULTISPECIES: PTS sugar transporter subunit IIA [Lactococcus]MBR6895692.1 PTS sugar transporter subunit IIA [Lactococcus sp.]MCJ1970251.1 PTS sugar transporter subunit IIA [Lactococcus carnosus]MDN5403981.1 PTS sugar transporter subunit IIA [Lactococcus sp.]MDN5409311.1 PTS sugar transporter subunit IIA [Lactococcus sp.]MDN5411373.1 PTS sugar transporter subunit IIA [Lactococcus sp.]